MVVIERENPTLKGVLPKEFAKPNLDKQSLGQLIDLVGKIALGDAKSRAKDVLGRVYEYFLGQFALAEGRKGGQFYTPESIVRLLVEMLEPYNGRVFDPCCGSGGMFVQNNWKSDTGTYEDIKGFCNSANITEIVKHKFVLTPGRYVGIPDEVDDGIPFEDKMKYLTGQLKEQMEDARKLDMEIKKQFSRVGFEI